MKDATAALAAKLLYLRFRQLDRERRWQGRLLEMAGYGAREQPGRRLATQPGARLKAYRSAPADGPVILLVPAPIKRSYLWDLAPDVSVVARLLEGGVRPYLVEWDAPDPASGLDDYAARHLAAAAAAVRAETGAASIFLAGHSLGGLFAAIFSSLYPALVRGLVLLGAPLHFGADAYMRGSLSVAGRRAAARAFAAPLFAVVDKRCPLVPPASVLPFLDAAASPDQRLAYYAGDIGVGIQHVGPLVGRSAHARLWPEIVRWLWQHWRQAPAAASG